MQSLAKKYVPLVVVSLAAIWAANNVDAVRKLVSKR